MVEVKSLDDLMQPYQQIANRRAIAEDRGPFIFMLGMRETTTFLRHAEPAIFSTVSETSRQIRAPYIHGAHIFLIYENIYLYGLDQVRDKILEYRNSKMEASKRALQAMWNHVKIRMLVEEDAFHKLDPLNAISIDLLELPMSEYPVHEDLLPIFHPASIRLIGAIRQLVWDSLSIPCPEQRLSFIQNMFAVTASKHGLCPPKWGEMSDDVIRVRP